MNRTQRLKINTITSLFNRFAILASGLILPRLILVYYGSETNGLVASINQFLAIITFLDLGVGSVIQAALYRPMARKDETKINLVIVAAKQYFRKIGYVLVAYVTALIVIYPLIVDNSFDYISTSFLIIALSINLFAQYFFGIVNELLLNADQRNYVQLSSEIIVVLLNLLLSTFLIHQGYSIQIVKLFAGIVFLLRPIYLSYYVKKHFNIDYNVQIIENPLPQKWSGVGQHIAYSIQNSTDIITLTIFSTLENISVYSIYNMIISAMKLLMTSLTDGLTSFFGNLLANDEIELLNNYFTKIEWLVHTLAMLLFGMTAVLIDEFVIIYTSGIDDVNYNAPIFSSILVIANVLYAIRIPYRRLIFSAGHFKQTQGSSFIEAGINIVISFILVNKLGLIGVAIGTLISMFYHIFYLVYYLSKNIVHRSIKKFMKHLLVDLVLFSLIVIIGEIILNYFNIYNLTDWILSAIVLGIVSVLIIIIVNLFFYKKQLLYYFRKVIKI